MQLVYLLLLLLRFLCAAMRSVTDRRAETSERRGRARAERMYKNA